LEIIALVRHADRDPPDSGPGIQPGAESEQRAVVRRPLERGEAERRSQELAALVEHGY
jgi:hypothetical protein